MSLVELLASGRVVAAAERGWFPDAGIRWGIRRALRERLRRAGRQTPEQRAAAAQAFRAELRRSPVALVPEQANRQHYEVPAAFFERVLGPRLKYSACLYPPGVASLAEAEARMLALTCERAGLEDGMRVLDLGCGWGSLALWIAEHYPRCRIVAVSNARAQGEFVRARAARLAGDRVRAVTADVNTFEPDARFDRVLSVEMFEHLRNWPLLLERIARWLVPDGRLFLHFFCHRELAYRYESEGRGDWMGRHFFTGGMMPSEGLILGFQEHLRVERRWRVGGEHYRRTCEAWLANLDVAREALAPVLAASYGEGEAIRAFGRWRIFFLACAELFAHAGGHEWGVAHVRLAPAAR